MAHGYVVMGRLTERILMEVEGRPGITVATVYQWLADHRSHATIEHTIRLIRDEDLCRFRQQEGTYALFLTDRGLRVVTGESVLSNRTREQRARRRPRANAIEHPA